MDVPEHFAVEDAAMAMDGGSIFLGLSTESGQQHDLLLVQHNIPSSPDAKRLRGRLYFDDQLVAVRSAAEAQILAGLRRAPIRAPAGPPGKPRSGPGMVIGEDIEAFLSKVEQGPAAATAHLVAELIRYVDSDEYVRFAKEEGA